MQQVRRLFSVFLVAVMLFGMVTLPADAADSGYELAILKVQKMDGTTYDPDSSEEVKDTDPVSAGDILVLTIGFGNTSGSAVDILGFAAKVLYDKEKVTPYKGTAPFKSNPYQNSTELSGDYEWAMFGNGKGDGFVSTAGSGSATYTVANNDEVVFSRMAFTVEADIGADDVVFSFDSDKTRSNITVDGGTLDLMPFKTWRPSGDTDDPGDGDDPGETVTTDQQLFVSKVQVWDTAEAFDPEGTGTTSAKPGDVVVLTIGAKNNKESGDIDINGFAAKLFYDKDVVATYTGTAPFKTNPYQNSTELSVDYEWAMFGNGKGDGFVSTAGSGSATYSIAAGETLVLSRMAFQVNADTTKDVAVFTFDTDKTKTNLTGASGSTLDLGTLQPFKLILGEAVPTTITPSTKALTLPDQSSVEFTVKDQAGNAMDNAALTWNVTPATGASVDNGKFTATAAGTYTVTASLNGKSVEATVTVTGEGGEPATPGEIAVTLEPETDELSIPASGSATKTFTATVTEDGNPVSNPDVTWSIAPDDVEGVTLNNGTVSVASDAAIDNDTEFTITATVGDKSATAKLMVRLLSVTFDDGKTEQTVEPDGEEDVTFQAEAKTPDGEDAADVTWTVENEDGTTAKDSDGVTVSETGKVTVAKDAKAGKYYVVAKSGSNETKVLVTVQGSAITALTLTPNPATVTVPVDGSPEPLTFAVKDQDNNDVDVTTLTWSLSETPTGVTMNNGTVTVNGTAYTGSHTVTVTASVGTVTGTATLTITKESGGSHVATLDNQPAQSVETDGKTDVTFQAAVKTASGENLPGAAWSVQDADGQPVTASSGVTVDASGLVTVAKDAAPGAYFIVATAGTDTAKVPLTVTAGQTQPGDTQMTVTGNKASIEIPGFKDNADTDTFKARFTATDKNKRAISYEDLTWTVVDRSTGQELKSTSVEWGKDTENEGSIILSVKTGAKDEITDTPNASGITGKTLLVTASRKSSDDSASATIVVRRADPELSVVTLSLSDANGTTTASTGEAPLSVISDGSGKIVVSVAKSQYDEVMSSTSAEPITWALRSGGNGLVLSGSGVTIDPNTGAVTINSNAKHGTYIVEATRTVMERTQIASAEMTISQTAEEVRNLTISGGVLEMEIPGKGQDPNVLSDADKFIAQVINQYNSLIPNADVTWTITDSNGNTCPGVTIEDGVVSVAYAAKDVVAANTRPIFKVKAKAGDVEKSKDIYIVRAAPVLNDLLIDGYDSATKQIDGTQDVYAQCTALDQYETEFKGTVTWNVSPVGFTGNGGVTVDETGLITILKDANPGNYNVTANTTIGPKNLLVSRDTPVPTTIVISGQNTVWIPADGQEPSTVSLRATVLDQFGSTMPAAAVTWTITDKADNTGAVVQGITVDSNGVVSVANEVKSLVATSNYADFKNMYVHAASGSASAEAFKLIVGRSIPVLSKVQLDGMDSPDSNGQRYTVDYTDGQIKTVTASALDQYSSPFRNASWDIVSYTDEIGITIDANGLITISNGAVSAEYTVVATYSTQTASAPFLIKKTSTTSTSISRIVVDPSTVTVSGNSMAISKATAYDGNDALITVGIIWGVQPANAGVSIDNNGNITVSSNATASQYLISATPDTTIGAVSGNVKSAGLTVNNASTVAAELDHVALTESRVTVDGTESKTSSARAFDSNNQDVGGVTWTITPANGGVSIDNTGTIHIFQSAIAGDYTIKATKNGITKEATLTVVNNPAVTLSEVILTPETVVVDGMTSASATARAVDSASKTVSGVTWSVSPDDKGVTIDANGNITVAGNAMLRNYTVTASSDIGTKSATLRVSNQPDTTQSLTGVTLNPATVTLDGTGAKTVIATTQGTVTDDITWTVSPGNTGVTLNATTGTTVQLTVAADATADAYEVTATHGDTSKSATLTLSASPLTPVALARVTLSPASVEVNGTENKIIDARAFNGENVAITSGITWSVSPLGNGVTVDAITGKVTVDKAAMSGDYTISATQVTQTRSNTLTVTNTAPKLTGVALDPASVTLNGTDAASSTATAVGSNDTTLTTGVTWTVSPTNGGVTIDTSGKITIAATAVSGEYLISAHYQSAVCSATLTVTSYADIVYEETPVDQSAVSDTPLAALSYVDTGVKSAEHQSSMKSAALAKDNVKQAVAEQSADTATEVVVSVEIKLQSYDAAKPSMKLSVTPVYQIVKTTNGQQETISQGTLDELPEAVKVTLNVPAAFDATFAQHTHNNTTYLEPISYTGTDSERVASWTQQYFSDVELTKDVVTIHFDAQGGTAISDKYVAKGGTLSSLPATARTGYTFNGWYLNNAQVTTATVFNQDSTLTAQWTVINNSSSGGGGGGGSSSGGSSSSSSTYKITTSAGSGGTLTASSKRATAESIITVTPTPKTGYELDTLTVVTTSGKKEVALTETNGTYTFEMPKANVTVKATFKKASSTSTSTDNGNTTSNTNTGDINPTPDNNTTPVNPTPSYTSVSFVDMQPDNFFYTAVQWAVERGITNGTTATTFSPNQACTRAQMVMFLWRSQGMPMPSTYNSPFTDVDPSANYYTAMMWAVERGITNGTTPTTFEPYAACTRAQMVMFLNRVAGRPRPTQWNCPFTDINPNEYYYEPMLWALEKGITNGTTATTFSPYQACTRAQMVMFLYRYLGGN